MNFHDKREIPPKYIYLFLAVICLILLFFSVVFVMIILGMFTISYYSKDNVNIINYENALIDKYEKWEAELIEREKQLENK